MGLVTGIDAIRKAVDKSSEQFEDGPRARWFSLKDGQSKKIVFLQEFDTNSPNYNEKNGALVMAVEHTAPKDYRKKALCTDDDGNRCFACEMDKREPKTGWNKKQRLYANVLVLDDEEEPYVAILSQGIGGKSITPTLLEIAVEFGSITTSAFKVRRSGAGMQNTSYALISLPGTIDIDPTKYELYDLSKTATRNVPYDEQPEFYGVVADESSSSTEAGEDFTW